MSRNNSDGDREHFKTYGPTRTDQAAGPATRIGYMINRFKNTGEKWPAAEEVLRYGDCSDIPSLHEMMTRVADANSAFQEIPVEIRHLCKHDASNLEEFLFDERNKQICIDFGLINPESAKPPVTEETHNEPNNTDDTGKSDEPDV